MRAVRSRPRFVIRALVGSGAVALSVLAWPGPVPAQVSPNVSPAAPAASGVSAPGESTGDVESLRERAAAFWAARVVLDADKQWQLLEPRGRGRMAAAEYAGAPLAVKYLAYQVEDANVRGYFATVQVRLIVQPVLPTAPQRRVAPAAVVVADRWVRIRGTWYRALEQE